MAAFQKGTLFMAAIGSTNYAQPVQVNGYTCKNCTDVDYAKKHIDPAHPKSGPFGIDAADDPSAKPAVKAVSDSNAKPPVKAAAPPGTGLLLDIAA